QGSDSFGDEHPVAGTKMAAEMESGNHLWSERNLVQLRLIQLLVRFTQPSGGAKAEHSRRRTISAVGCSRETGRDSVEKAIEPRIEAADPPRRRGESRRKIVEP